VELTFHSILPAAFKEEVERLLFFNEGQHRIQGRIAKAVDLYGLPTITESQGGLTVTVSGCPEAQCLFVVNEHHQENRSGLAAVVLFTRPTTEELLVLHLSVDSSYGENRDGLRVVFQIVRVLRACAQQLRGVQWLRFLYSEGRQFQVRISRNAASRTEVALESEQLRLVS
jgi:hypothetical protein